MLNERGGCDKIGGLNKRAQEGVTTTTLLVIVLGIVVVVLVIIGATGGLNFVFEKFKVAPGQSLEAVIQSCNIAGESQLKGDFCLTFKKVAINGVDQYVTCDYPGISSSLSAGADFKCGDVTIDQRSAQYCLSGTIKGADLSKVLINGKTCFTLLSLSNSMTSCSAGSGYQVKQDAKTCGTSTLDITSLLTSEAQKGLNGNKCCLALPASA